MPGCSHGRQHSEDDRQWSRDVERREQLDADGWRLIVIRSKDIYAEPHLTLRRITDAMRQAGAANLPRQPNPEWERHFPRR